MARLPAAPQPWSSHRDRCPQYCLSQLTNWLFRAAMRHSKFSLPAIRRSAISELCGSANLGYYSVILSNSYGMITSSVASLVLSTPTGLLPTWDLALTTNFQTAPLGGSVAFVGTINNHLPTALRLRNISLYFDTIPPS